MEDRKRCNCPPPPPECCNIPVVVERVIRPYFNPDGTPSSRKYYQYPITRLDAIYQTSDIHSPTLDVILEKMRLTIDEKQPMIASGEGNTILTRGKTDGTFGELIKSDYLDENRRSKSIIPSEYSMYKSFDALMAEMRSYTDKETVRSTAVENSLHEEIHDEVNRATEAEDAIKESIQMLDQKKINISIGGNTGLILKNIAMDFTDLTKLTWTTRQVNVTTGQKVITEHPVDITPQLNTIIENNPVVESKLDKSAFEHTTLVTSSEFKPGVGNSIGRFTFTTRDMDTDNSTTKNVSFKANNINFQFNDVSSDEVEITFSPKFASDEMVQSMIDRLFA